MQVKNINSIISINKILFQKSIDNGTNLLNIFLVKLFLLVELRISKKIYKSNTDGESNFCSVVLFLIGFEFFR